MIGLHRSLFRRVCIVGVGLIGGSVGMAIKKKKLAQHVVGVSTHQASLSIALERQAIDEGIQDVKKAVRDCDFVVLATPVQTILGMMDALAPVFRRGVIITDVGSSKSVIVEKAQRALPPSALFVGSHPLAGSEKKGPAYASAELFEGSTCIMTPTEKTNRFAKDKVKHFWTQLGAHVKTLTPQQHDETLSYISHLPHLIAYGLMKTIPDEFLEYASTGLKDTTRIAASNPAMWNDICLSNAKNILKSLDSVIKEYAQLRKAIVSNDDETLIEHFKQAKDKRDRLG